MSTDRAALVDLVYASCALLDAEAYESWLGLCAPDFRYRITAYSDEIGKEMVWLDQSLEQLRVRFEDLPRHLVVPGTYRRHAGRCREIERSEARVRMESSVIVYHTDPQGTSRLFAVVTYHDDIALDGAAPRLAERTVRMDTRRLEFSPSTIL